MEITETQRETLNHIRRTLLSVAGKLDEVTTGEIMADVQALDIILHPYLHAGYLSDVDAQKIASDWHGGGGSALYAFASTGAILPALIVELADIIDQLGWEESEENRECAAQLRQLSDYADHYGERGPVWAWHRRVICAA